MCVGDNIDSGAHCARVVLRSCPGTDDAELVVALVEHLLDGGVIVEAPGIEEFTEVGINALAHGLDGIARSFVCRDWLGDQLLDHAESLQVGRGNEHGLGSFGSLAGILPEKRGACFRRSYGVHGILQHQQAISEADAERSA